MRLRPTQPSQQTYSVVSATLVIIAGFSKKSIPIFLFFAVRPPHDRKEVEPCGGPRKVIYIYTLRIALFFGRVNGFHRTILTNFLSSLPEEKNRRRPESLRRPGAERGIRTLERVLTVTRFPIVRLRPAQPSVHNIRYYNSTHSKCQEFFYLFRVFLSVI